MQSSSPLALGLAIAWLLLCLGVAVFLLVRRWLRSRRRRRMWDNYFRE
ncbi:hypothetical protein KV697_17775 [Sphingomonas sanguinis]|nr:hypothetical protein [Sphingomonas sanguinis]QXT35550.1 hypothetical protein KV697_17775 [Sphingomonas sanguinis]